MDLSVDDNPTRQRFEVRLGGDLVGFAAYREREGVVAITHTEVNPSLRGRGIGGVLVGGALDRIRADGHLVRPVCWFVAEYIERNPGYADLVAP
jgi:predicted GNAT family acetyltransferase